MNRVITLALGILLFPAAWADESVNFAYSLVDDGSCADALQTLQLGYINTSENLDIRGDVRIAPSGGDCRQDSMSYGIEIERRYDLGWGLDGMVKLGADERSVAAGYGILNDAGNLITRPDGGPASPVMLPSGRAQTITGVLGVSRDIDDMFRLSAGLNLPGADWSDGSNSRTVHLAASTMLPFMGGEIDAGIAVDTDGTYDYGDARIAWTRSLADSAWDVMVSSTYSWGASNLDAGVPQYQMFSGLNAMVLGPAQDDSSTFAIGFRRSL